MNPLRPPAVALLPLLLVLSGPAARAAAQEASCLVTCDGAQEVPPVETDGTATLVVAIDPRTRTLTVEGSFANLNGSVSEAHVHGPAAPGTAGPTILDLQVSGTRFGTVRGSGILSPARYADLVAGLLYVNVHARGSPAGEVRGQLDCFVAAAAKLRNGSGVNPVGLLTSQVPRIGETWEASIDVPGSRASALIVLGGGPATIALRRGELLGLPPILSFSPSRTGAYRLAVPGDGALMGVRVSTQGVVFGRGGARLTNALDLTFGL